MTASKLLISLSPIEAPGTKNMPTLKDKTPDAGFENSFDNFDRVRNPRPQATDFSRVVDEAISRRTFIGTGVGFGLSSFVLGAGVINTPRHAKADGGVRAGDELFGFQPIGANSLDTITLPEGFEWQVVVQWGDPLWSVGAELDEATGGTADSQVKAFGDNNDGMAFFEHDGRKLIVVNNEYINKRWLLPHDGHKPLNKDDFLKSKAAHGISVIELTERAGLWSIVRDSPFNRRITPDSPMEITGPAAGHQDMQTSDDPSGLEILGTMNNCGNGVTPWGTYLACEENFNGYFASSDPGLQLSLKQKRYGIGHEDFGYHWYRFETRFDISKEPNEANRFGYVVEFDPSRPDSPLKKRTKLGRFKHENAEVVLSKDRRVIVYMGDDEEGEFLYKFVSRDRYLEGEPTDKLLNKGTLYAAKFFTDGSGAWLPLTPETTSMSEAEICIYSRLAASKVKATTMDRPEWVAAHPDRAEVYCALTNNRSRGVKANLGSDGMPIGGPNPRAENLYGQIVSWWPDKDDHVETGFTWRLFALAGNPDVHKGEKAGSENITSDNLFNSPDGLHFDQKGRLWIQTDGNYSDKGEFAHMGNNQMLVGDPASGEIRRFLVGPRECEITGLTFVPDGKSLFVGIQHPGERGGSHFPLGGNHVPRSAVIAVRRTDGQPI